MYPVIRDKKNRYIVNLEASVRPPIGLLSKIAAYYCFSSVRLVKFIVHCTDVAKNVTDKIQKNIVPRFGSMAFDGMECTWRALLIAESFCFSDQAD